ncbi:MAG: metal-sulfur cluster assembly factor [Anaerolineae bacterium]|nr:metal-sulfur cluster assembly factor [Anaerolineae bacterium]
MMSEETVNNEVTEENGVTEESVREALRGVMDPELHLDVVTLGLIREIDLESTPVHVKMVLTTPFCPYGPWMVGQIKEMAEYAVGDEVKVEVLAEQWHPEMMEDPTLLGFF